MPRKKKSAVDLAYITPQVLSWALAQSGQSREAVAGRLKIEPEQIASWEQQRSYPQFDTAQELARILRILLDICF